MNKKPVFWADPGDIIKLRSDFEEKALCDGPTFTVGLACAYKCSFCYVEAQLQRHPTAIEAKKAGHAFSDIVIRRKNALQRLEAQLLTAKGMPKYTDPNDRRVIYSSPLVDVAANLELVKETIEACKLILKLTPWQIRLLSKSSFLPLVAAGIPPQHKHRMIFGVSTGTLQDKLANAFEEGTALVSKRIASIRALQDDGWRTYGMICPSLPLDGDDYDAFSKDMADALRVARMEHVWAEVINVRGESMKRTVRALRDAGYESQALGVEYVSDSGKAWETYARQTFEAHVRNIPKGKLRFLQYVKPESKDWWMQRRADGAVPLGAAVHAE